MVVGFGRLGAIAELLVSEAKAGPGIGVLVVDVQRGVEVLDRLGRLADGDQAFAARLIGRADEGVAVDGIVEIGDRRLIVALALEDQPAR